MNIVGARLIDLDAARALIAAHFRRDIIDDELMFAEPDRYGRVLLLPDGCAIAGDLELEWETATHDGERFRGIIAEGRLSIAGDILSSNWDGGPFLVALGKTEVRHIIKRGAPLAFVGPLHAAGTIYCEYNHGSFRALGGLHAEALVIDDHLCDLRGPVHGIVFDAREDDAREFLFDAFYYEDDDGEVSLIDDAAAAMTAAIRAGRPIFKADAPRRGIGPG